MKKRIISLVIIVVMMLGILPAIPVANAATTSGDCGNNGDNVTWEFDDETGVIKFSGTGEMKTYAPYSSPPWSSFKSSIISVVISRGITSICEEAFWNCDNLISVELPDSLVKIRYKAFFNCKKLTNITIPNSVTEIGHSVFLNCNNLVSVKLPDKLTKINESLFEGCGQLKSITIPDTVNYIGPEAFYDTRALSSINIPYGVQSIPDRAFYRSGITSITLPDSVSSIGDAAFYYCEKLRTVDLGKKITVICESAFTNCFSLKTIVIPKTVTKIYSDAFYNCNSISDIYYGGTEAQYATIVGKAPQATNMHYIVASNSQTNEGYWTFEEAIADAKDGDTLSLTNDVTITNATIDEGVTLDLNGNTITANGMVNYNGSAIVDNSEDKSGKLYIPKNKAIFAQDNPQLAVYDNKNGCFTFAEMRTKSSNGSDRYRLDYDEKTGIYTYSVSPVFGESAAARTLVHSLLNQSKEDSGVTVEIFVAWENKDGEEEERRYKYSDSTVRTIVNGFSGTNYSHKFSAKFKWSDITDAKTAKICTIIRSTTNVEIRSEVIDINVA